MGFLEHCLINEEFWAVGLPRAALEESVRYTKQREQFGTKLASFQVTQFKIAEMATWIRAARNLYTRPPV